jgi:hypothetical protein
MVSLSLPWLGCEPGIFKLIFPRLTPELQLVRSRWFVTISPEETKFEIQMIFSYFRQL